MTKSKRTKVDVRVVVCGSIIQFHLLTPKARQWVADNLEVESWQWLGNALCVDWRYADAIACMMQDSGGDGPILILK